MAARKTVKTIETLVSLGRQGVFYKELLSFGDHKLRIDIESDSYEFQCKAKISVLQKGDVTKWETLDYIPHGAMQTKAQLYYHVNHNPAGAAMTAAASHHFQADREHLITNAKALLA